MIKINDKPEDISQRVFRFVLHTVQFAKRLQKDHTNLVMVNQLVRCVTSIGANIEEARGGHTKNDFAHAMNIAKKEALETRYWLNLVKEINNINTQEIVWLLSEIEEIIKILASIVKKAHPRSA